jgi:hypothetical protein
MLPWRCQSALPEGRNKKKTKEKLVMKGPKARWVGKQSFWGGLGYAATDQVTCKARSTTFYFYLIQCKWWASQMQLVHILMKVKAC